MYFYLYGIEVDNQPISYPKCIYYNRNYHRNKYSYVLIYNYATSMELPLNRSVFLIKDINIGVFYRMRATDFLSDKESYEDLFGVSKVYATDLWGEKHEDWLCSFFNSCIEVFNKYTDLNSLRGEYKNRHHKNLIDCYDDLNWLLQRLPACKYKLLNDRLFFTTIERNIQSISLSAKFNGDINSFKGAIAKYIVLEQPYMVFKDAKYDKESDDFFLIS